MIYKDIIMKKYIGLSCFLTYITLFPAANGPELPARAQVTIENATNEDDQTGLYTTNLTINGEATTGNFLLTLKPGETRPLDAPRESIQTLSYKAESSWRNPYPATYQIDLSNKDPGSLLIKIKATSTGYPYTIRPTSAADVQGKIALSKAPDYLSTFLALATGANLNFTFSSEAVLEFQKLVGTGTPILDIVKTHPYLLLGFANPVEVTENGRDNNQNINSIKEHYDGLKGLLGQETSKGVESSAQAGKALQLLRQARYHMLEGSESQRQELLNVGKALNDALTKSNAQQLAGLKESSKGNFGEEFYEQYLVAALLTYYYDIARNLGHIFEEGTFVVYDDTGNIFRFLSSLAGVEPRNASHLNSLANTEGYQWLIGGTEHPKEKNFYGFDVNLPSENKGTVLFNKIDSEGKSIFIKPEHAGVKTAVDKFYHTVGVAASLQRKFGPTIITQAAGLKHDDHPDYSKERVPEDIRNEWKKIIAALGKKIGYQGRSDQTKPPAVEELEKYDDYKGIGIQRMLELAEGRKLVSGINLKNQLPNETQTFIDMINQRAESEEDSIMRAKYTHLDKRFGHEVILTDEEFNRY